MDTCSSLHDVEGDTFTPSAMQLLPGLVIQMPSEFCPDNPMEMPPELILPPPPILELPMPSCLPTGGAGELDTQSETDSCHREHHRKHQHRRRKVKHRPKEIETTVVVEAASLLPAVQHSGQDSLQGPEEGPAESTEPLLTTNSSNTRGSSQPSEQSHPHPENFEPQRESIV